MFLLFRDISGFPEEITFVIVLALFSVSVIGFVF